MTSPITCVLLIDILLLTNVGWLFLMPRESAAVATFFATFFLLVWQLALYIILHQPNQMLRVEKNIRTPHYIQMGLQACLYAYWGSYWNEVWPQLPLIIAQVLFAYGFEMLLSWSRYRTWRAGFGQIPIVFSVNLFLWFRDPYYVLQFVLIAIVLLGKEFITWHWDGRRRHIFNPSSGALAVVSVVLLATGQIGISRGVDIVGSFELPPNFLEVIFLVGLVVQLLFRTTWITFGAVVSLEAFYRLGSWWFGGPLGPTAIDPAVFLGTTLLVTDPATTPTTRIGKLLFGLTYGMGVFFTCIALRMMQQPGVFDKILVVPLMNLLAPWFDRVSTQLFIAVQKVPNWVSNAFATRWVPVVFYTGLFLTILPELKIPDYRPNPLPAPAVNFSQSVSYKLLKTDFCRKQMPEVYRPFGFKAEIHHYATIRKFYDDDPLKNR